MHYVSLCNQLSSNSCVRDRIRIYLKSPPLTQATTVEIYTLFRLLRRLKISHISSLTPIKEGLLVLMLPGQLQANKLSVDDVLPR